jgi:hypothetical protein
MRINEILLQEQKLDEVPTLGQIASGIQGAVAGFQQGQQQRALGGQQSALAKTAYDQWNRKVMALTNAAGGQPVDINDYENHLVDFVQKVVLNNRRIDDLDQSSQTRINAVIDEIVKNQSDRAGLQKAFQNLIVQASVARSDPAKQQQVPNPQQMIQRMQGGTPIRQTGNPAVDQLLAALGIPVSK